eukprot:347288-Chlamydomonas_euryale.AAC.1
MKRSGMRTVSVQVCMAAAPRRAAPQGVLRHAVCPHAHVCQKLLFICDNEGWEPGGLLVKAWGNAGVLACTHARIPAT